MRRRASAEETRGVRCGVDTVSQSWHSLFCDTTSQPPSHRSLPPLMPSMTRPSVTPTEHESSLQLPDGRTLSYASWGDPGRPVVVVLDGPGSRGLARGAAPAAVELGLRLVAPDRPGFFGSTPAPGRTVADWPADHAALLDVLEAGHAGILGQSGGSPFAYTVAAALPQRTSGVAMVGALAPLDDRTNLNEVRGPVRTGLKLARRAPWLLRLLFGGMSRSAAKNPEKAARKMLEDLPAADIREVECDPALFDMHVQAMGEILSRPDAMVRELRLMAAPWGVDLGSIAVPVAFWSGDGDTTHPTSHSRRLAETLGGVPVHVVPGAATFGMRPSYPDMLRFAAEI